MRLAGLLVLLLLAGAAEASEERLFAAPPAGWKQVFQEHKGSRRVHKFVPPGQGLEAWTEMVSIQVFEDLAGVAAVDFARRMAEEARKGCDRHEGREPDSREVNGYAVSLLLTECRRGAPSRVEVLMATVIRGREGIYLVQRSWRGDQAGGGNPLMGREAREDWLAFMGTVELCDLARREAPCKSLGMPGHAEALALMEPVKDQVPAACPYVRVVAVRPDTTKAVGPRRAFPLVVGVNPFGGEMDQVLDLIVKTAKANVPVAVVIGVAGKETPAEILKRGEAEAKDLTARLQAKGLPAERLVQRANPECR